MRRVDRYASLLLGRLSGLAKVEAGNHIVDDDLVTSGSTEAIADVISSTTGEQTNRLPGMPALTLATTAKGAFAVLPQDLGTSVRVRDVRRMRQHPSASGIRARDLSIGAGQSELEYSAARLVCFRP